MERFEVNLTKFKFPLLAIFAGTFIIFFLKLSDLRTELRVFDIYDPNFKSSEDLRQMRNDFGDQNAVQVLITKDRTFSHREACQINQEIQKIVYSLPEVVRFVSPQDYRRPHWNGSNLWYPPILEFKCDSQDELELSELRSSPFGETMVGKGNNLVYEIEFSDSKDQNRYGKFDPTPIGKLLKKIEGIKRPDLHVHLGGKSAIQWHLKEMFEKDVIVNFSIIIFIILTFRLLYGTWSSGSLFILTVIISSVITFGIMAFFNVPLDLLTNSLFMMIVISCLEDFIFVSQEMLIYKRNDLKPFSKLLAPSFFTSLTTIIGFAALYFSDLYIIKRFGLLGAVAAFVEWIATFFILPVILLIFSRKKLNWTNDKKAYAFKSLGKLSSITPSRWSTRLLLFLGLISLLSFPFINYNDHPDKNFSINHPHRQHGEVMKKIFGHQGSAFLEFPISNESKEREILGRIERLPNVVVVQSPWKIIDYMLNELPGELHSLVKIEIKSTRSYDNFFAERKSRSVIFFKEIEQKEINETISNIKAICLNDCKPVGEIITYNEFSEKVTTTLFEGLLLSLLIICLVILLLCLKFQITPKWPIFISILWCPSLLIGILALTCLPINLVTCIVGSIFVGLAGDNIIQFIYSSAQKGGLEASINSKGQGAVYLVTISSISSLFFLGFTLVPLRYVGSILFLGFISIYIGDLLVLKGLIKKPSGEV